MAANVPLQVPFEPVRPSGRANCAAKLPFAMPATLPAGSMV
jgi:hypothetical protein